MTPSWNQGRYIEKTIQSVLLQDYPNLEYIVIDGGSADDTTDILKKYEDHIDYWVSEKDKGQSHAIAKGVARATGEIFNWLNADDYLAPGALHKVAKMWNEGKPDIIAGRCPKVTLSDGTMFEEDWLPRRPKSELDLLLGGMWFAQPATFLGTEAYKTAGGIREDLHYVMDWELYVRMCRRGGGRPRVAVTDKVLAYYGYHEASKGVRAQRQFFIEGNRVRREVIKSLGEGQRRELARRIAKKSLLHRIWRVQRRSDNLLQDLLKLGVRYPTLFTMMAYWKALRAATKMH